MSRKLTPEYLRRLFLAVTDHLTAIRTQCQRSYQMFESLVEAQIKVQLREHVRAWLVSENDLRIMGRRSRPINPR